jgi:hypothetical protein
MNYILIIILIIYFKIIRKRILPFMIHPNIFDFSQISINEFFYFSGKCR